MGYIYIYIANKGHETRKPKKESVSRNTFLREYLRSTIVYRSRDRSFTLPSTTKLGAHSTPNRETKKSLLDDASIRTISRPLSRPPWSPPRYTFHHWINSKQYIAAIVNRPRFSKRGYFIYQVEQWVSPSWLDGLSPLFFLSFFRSKSSSEHAARSKRFTLFQPHRVEDDENWRGGDLGLEREREKRGVSFHEILTQFPRPLFRRYRCLIVARTKLRPGMKTGRKLGRKTVLPRGEDREISTRNSVQLRSFFLFFFLRSGNLCSLYSSKSVIGCFPRVTGHN